MSLSEAIAELNDRFGLELGTSDEVLIMRHRPRRRSREADRRRAYRIVRDPARDEALAALRAEMEREVGVYRVLGHLQT